MRRGKAIGWTLLLGLVAWALVGRGLVNYDTLYALVWGRDLTHGTLPDYDVSLAPTPHPLATLAGAILSVLGAEGAIGATIVLAFVFLGALAWVTYRLGEAWVNRAAGALAAAIVLTRQPVLDFGARAYVDVPYLALVLGALLVETRRRRAGAPVLALLGVAGLIRPEAWLFSGAYLVWLWIGGVRDPRLWALAAAAPLLWALGDLVVTGDPLHSLTGTRDTAQRLQRVTGLDEVPGTVPRRLGEILREPVLFGAAGGGLLALAFLRKRVALGAAAGVIAIVAFCVLADRRPADPRALPARARRDPRHLLRRRRLRLGRASARAPLAAALGVVRGGDARRPRRLHPRAGRSHRQAARRPAHPERHPGRPARPQRALPVRADHGAQPPSGAAAGPVAGHRPRAHRRRPGAPAAERHLRGAEQPARRAPVHPRPARRRSAHPAAAGRLRAAWAPTRRGAPSRAARRRRRTVHPPSKQVYERFRLERLRHRDFPLRTPGSA